MSHLYRHLPIHQIFGANTNVGKTIVTTALVRSSNLTNRNAFYLKPVSTGAPEDADDAHVQRYAGLHQHLLNTHCLFQYDDPVSPHLAVRMASQRSGLESCAPSDETFVNAIAEHIRVCARSGKPGHMFIETAGGVHSPTLSGTTQLESYRPLFLPTILVGDSNLGGISSTISSYESLLLRGYIVDAILLFRDDYYRNHEYLLPYFAERGVNVTSLEPPPPLQGNIHENISTTESYYAKLVPGNLDSEVYHALRHLDECHANRIEELDSMPRRTLDTVWWPFVQHGLVKSEKDVTVIDSAWADFFSVYNPTSTSTSTSTSQLAPKLDGSASWWTQAVGHAAPSLALTAASAAGRYGHVMFPQATHLPALRLAERLVHKGPGVGWASRAFFTDNGSTGMEVALKMALRAFSITEGELTASDKKNLWIVGLKGSYHGDTIGAMDAAEEGIYTCEWHNAKGFWFEPPTVGIKNGNHVVTIPSSMSASTSSVLFDDLHSIYDVENRLDSPLADTYRVHVKNTLRALRQKGKLAALVLEPILMGAGGMIFVDPLFQRVLVDAVRDKSLFDSPLPVIFDEVFVGLYRLGIQSFGPILGVNPDIAVYAKILTGGVLPLSVTLASERVFQAFNGRSKVAALLHGHSYTAHAVGCQVANTTLDMIEKLVQEDAWRLARGKWRRAPQGAVVWSFWDPDFVHSVSGLDVVEEAMALGTVLVIKFKDDDAGYTSHTAQSLLRSIERPVSNGPLSSAPGGAPFGIHYRTLGNVAYFMTSLNTPLKTIEEVEDRLWTALSANACNIDVDKRI